MVVGGAPNAANRLVPVTESESAYMNMPVISDMLSMRHVAPTWYWSVTTPGARMLNVTSSGRIGLSERL